MASLRGGQQLWNGATVNQNDKSANALIGPGPYVTLYITNTGANAATFDVEVSATASSKGGRNALDSTADGGLTWFPYNGASGASSITVPAGKSLAIDLAPFSPPFVRLKRTDANGATTITALVSAFGAN